MAVLASQGKQREARAEAELPLVVRDRLGTSPARAGSTRRWVLLAAALLFIGGIAGLFLQPQGQKLLAAVTGLGEAASPPAGIGEGPDSGSAATLPSADRVVALGRLIPRGDVTTVALPYGARDARIAEVRVQEGESVRQGDVLAVLDNLQDLESAVAVAEADLAVREASLAQTRQSVRASIEEAEATLERAEAAAEEARSDLQRSRSLLDRGVTTQAVFDEARSEARQADQEIERARAALSRYESETLEQQVDVVVAARSVDAARTALGRAERDLAKGYVRAPIDGTVLDVHVRAGEEPGEDGVMDLGDLETMTAELEVHQSDVGSLAPGDPVEIWAEALPHPLQGTVTVVGLAVRRQALTSDDPAANTDARVVEVTVALDPESSTTAARFTNLQVTAWVTTGSDG